MTFVVFVDNGGGVTNSTCRFSDFQGSRLLLSEVKSQVQILKVTDSVLGNGWVNDDLYHRFQDKCYVVSLS